MRGDAVPTDPLAVTDPFAPSPDADILLPARHARGVDDPLEALFAAPVEDPFSHPLADSPETSAVSPHLTPASRSPISREVQEGGAAGSDRDQRDASPVAPPAGDARGPEPDPGPRAPSPPSPITHGAPQASPPGAAQVAPQPDARSVLAALLAGAGLPDVPVTDELAATFGQILKAVVGGLIDTLNSRQAFKEEFRAPTTRIRTVDNNPLKFSVDAQDALKNLLGKRSASYLEPVEAFDDAFADLQEHQMAMLAGIRHAFEQMLQRFDPEGLQRQFDRFGSSRTWLGVATKPAYWDLYSEMYKDWARDPDRAFRELFGEELGRAYEAQVARLKAGRPGKS